MSITRKLRKWVEDNRSRLYMGWLSPYEVGTIADEIDAEHKRLTDKAHADGERSAMKQVRSRSVDYKKGYEQAMADVEERTKTEQNGAERSRFEQGSSITDELREYAEINECKSYCKLLNDIADRIDERYSVKAERLEKYRAAVSAMLKEYVKMPVDADGVPIHIGDVMEWSNGSFTVHELKLTEDGWQTWDSEHGYTVHADECIHHQPDTWERIIEDALHAFLDDDSPAAPTKEELVERCKKLAGESE